MYQSSDQNLNLSQSTYGDATSSGDGDLGSSPQDSSNSGDVNSLSTGTQGDLEVQYLYEFDKG